MKNYKIIALHGAMGVGKDTAGIMFAELIQKAYHTAVYNQRFAQAVKENVSNMTGVIMGEISGLPYRNKVYDFTGEQKAMFLPDWEMTLGQMLQIYATEAVRDHLHSDAWILSMKPKLKPGVNVITDLRFENEIKWLNDVGAIKVKIIRQTEDLKDGRDTKHRSELGLDDQLFDYVIQNNGSLDNLREKVINVCQDLRKEYLQ